MSELNINVEGGSSTKLLTAGKYCPEDIIITASGGGGGEVEPIELTGDCGYAVKGKIGTYAMNTIGNKISTKGVISITNMFYENKCEKIPFEINMDNGNYRTMDYPFQYCENLKEAPMINNAYPSTMTGFFRYCYRMRNLPDDFGSDWNYDRIQTYNYAGLGNMFLSCYSLRKIPESFLSNLWGVCTADSNTIYANGFNSCNSLDEIKGLGVHQGVLTSNAFSTTFQNCTRVKDIIFVTNEDGTAKTAQWKKQTIDLSNTTWPVGYCNAIHSDRILKYNSGITADKKVQTDSQYQALKNDADWWTDILGYSRYNHDSAVNTINSLPDISAYLAANGGTNTIKFKGYAGAYTDGGAIETLTDAEIAVAAAKGWTVTLV